MPLFRHNLPEPNIPGRLLRAWLFSMLLIALPAQGKSETAAASENAIKAAIVFKIAKFVSWPEQAFNGISEPLSVCLHQSDPLADALNSLSGKAIHGRVFNVRFIEESGLVDKAKSEYTDQLLNLSVQKE